MIPEMWWLSLAPRCMYCITSMHPVGTWNSSVSAVTTLSSKSLHRSTTLNPKKLCRRSSLEYRFYLLPTFPHFHNLSDSCREPLTTHLTLQCTGMIDCSTLKCHLNALRESIAILYFTSYQYNKHHNQTSSCATITPGFHLNGFRADCCNTAFDILSV